MMSGVTGRLPRVAREPLQYGDWTIPPGTPVSQLNYVVNNDPDLFPHPLEFRPERWVDAPPREDGRRLDRYMVSGFHFSFPLLPKAPQSVSGGGGIILIVSYPMT